MLLSIVCTFGICVKLLVYKHIKSEYTRHFTAHQGLVFNTFFDEIETI